MGKSQPGSFPLKTGDRLVLSIDGEEQEGTVKNKKPHRIKAEGEFGKAILKMTGGKDGGELRIEVEQKDGEGRKLLTEDR